MTHTRRLFTLIGVAIILLVITIVSLFFKNISDTQPSIIPTPTTFVQEPSISVIQLKPTFIPENQIPTEPATPVPKQGDLIISGIAVNNFYKSAIQQNSNGDVLIAQTDAYRITYLKQFEQFIISLTGSDTMSVQKEAEQKFLEILGIDAPNACRLTIQENVPATVDNKYAGNVFIPSFCEQHEDSTDM